MVGLKLKYTVNVLMQMSQHIRITHIEPALKFFGGIQLMMTSNMILKKEVGNGSKLKMSSIVNCKTLDWILIYTVSCLNVEYMIY